METKYFASLMYGRIFKTSWTSNHEYTNIFLNRIIKYITNYDIKDYILTINELPLKSKNSIASRVDILLVSKDKTRIINIELNPKLKKTTNNKNLSYLFKLAAEYYKHNDKDKYLHDIDVIQVNLNGYYHQNKDILISKYTLYDKQDIYNDLSLFTCTSYKEIAMEAREQGFSIEETSKLLKIDQNIIKRALKKDN